jgi:hypothetical protein
VRTITRLQAVYHYFHPQSPRGGLDPYGPPRSLARAAGEGRTAREEFRDARRAEGLPDWRISQLWDELAARARAVAGGGKEARALAARRQREKDRGRPGRDG